MSKTESPIKLVCKYVDELALIEVDPFKNYEQAPICLEVDWELREIDVNTHYSDGSMSMSQYHNLKSRYNLPGNIDILSFQKEWDGSELQKVFSELADTWHSEWNGSNWIGQFGDRDDYSQDISDLLENLPTVENAGIWDFCDWYCNGEADYPENYIEMKTIEIAAEMIYAAKIEESVVIRDSLSTVVGILNEREAAK